MSALLEKPRTLGSPSALKRYFQEKLAAEVGHYELNRMMEAKPDHFVILDVRSPESFRAGHLPRALHIPFGELESRLLELAKDDEIVCYCSGISSLLSARACYLLASKGYIARELIGGFSTWKKLGFPVEQ